MAEARNPQQQGTSKNQPRREEREGSRAMERRSGEQGGYETTTPFSLMQRYMSDMERFFSDFGLGFWPRSGERGMERGSFAPRVDMFERDGHLVVQTDLPGLRPEDVRIRYEKGVLVISGERTHSHEHKEGSVYRCERTYGNFQRTLALPEGVDPDQIQASFNDGVLEVNVPLPKSTQQSGKEIPVRAQQSVKH